MYDLGVYKMPPTKVPLIEGDSGSDIRYVESSYSFNEALDNQMNIKGKSSPKYWVGGDELWRNASRAQVMDAMSIDELLSDPVNKMQFLDLHYQDGYSVEDLDVLLDGKGVLAGKGAAFLKASEDNNINPIYLVAHALHESDNGTSQLAKYNNFFGLGANDGRAIAGGRDFAEKHHWTTPELGITGAAEIISKKWVNSTLGSQSTLYSMRWNPMNPGKTPQYATDIAWAHQQSHYIYTQVSKLQEINPLYRPLFIVPKYS